ncbi:MAG: hypothetical protein ABIQ40_20310 [Bacteroidia bacterium]
MTNYSELAKAYNSADLMKTVAAMQLLPQNHGKNLRLEELTRLAVVNLNESKFPLPLEEFKEVIQAEFPESLHEDRPVNLFTENAMFIGGNYIVFPGVFEGGAGLLNNLLKSVLLNKEDEIPDAFIKEAQEGVLLILCLANYAAEQCNLTRNVFEKPLSNALAFPESNQLELFKNALTFTEDQIKEQCKLSGIDSNIVSQFIIDINDPALRSESPALSPLMIKPLIKLGDEYIFLQPISTVECLVNFIWEEAQKHQCYDTVLQLYHDWQWIELQQLCFQMQWWDIGIELPALSKDIACRETILGFDLNKVVYLCFIEKRGDYLRTEVDYSTATQPSADTLALCEPLEKRKNEIQFHLKKELGNSSLEIFTLYIFSEVGCPQFFSLPSPSNDQVALWFRLSELKRIVQLEDPDPLLLWKFAKNHTEVFHECEIVNLGGMLDLFVLYLGNEYTLWPVNEERPEEIRIMPGCSSSYSQYSIQKRDEHLAPFPTENDIIYKPVYNHSEYAPFYMEVWDSIPSPILLEDFPISIWFLNDQKDTQHEQLINMHLEMLAFWLWKLGAHVKQYFDNYDRKQPLVVKVVFESRFKKEMRPSEIPELLLEQIIIPISGKHPEITIIIPLELAHWYAKPHNAGESYVIWNFLQHIIQDGTEQNAKMNLKKIIDQVIPLGPAKMASMLGTNNIILEARYLPAFRPIQQYDTSFIKINLIRLYNVSVNPEDLLSNESKKNLCTDIGEKLFKSLCEKLKSFELHELLPFLLGFHEACVQQKAIRILDLPARIACLGSFNEQVTTLMIKEQDRVKTALALRCLIELIVAYDPMPGKRSPNFDEIDEMIAMMYEVISWRTLSDGIHLGLYDPDITLLACGRIGVDYSNMNSSFVPFTNARANIELNQYNKNYESLFESPIENIDERMSPETTEIEQAFITDWGVGLVRLNDFAIDLVNLVRRSNVSVIGIEEKDLRIELKKTKFNWNDIEITSALKVLSLVSGWDIDAPPPGYRLQDTHPWHYRRPLSFLRKPIARLVKDDKVFYYWSYRHLFASIDNIVFMLFEGTLWVPEEGAINKLVAKVRDKKGGKFRNHVVQWLKENTSLEVIPYEIKIRPGARLNAHKNLGDIDIMVVDHEHKIIFCIECKNTVDSRSVHEIKTEIDKYIGRKEGDGLIQKHVNRYAWLKSNQTSLEFLVANAEEYLIKALMLTYEEIPLPHIKKGSLPMDIISFERLKIEGIELLRNSK